MKTILLPLGSLWAALGAPGFAAAQFSFTVQSQPGVPVEILASRNVAQPTTNWASLAILTNVTGALVFTDAAPRLDRRFYQARTLGAPRLPLGVYAKVDLSEVIRSNPTADWNSYFDCLFKRLLANPAISGLTLNVRWGLINANSGLYR